MFITFEGSDEIIVTTPEKRTECIELYFGVGNRDLLEYDEYEYNDCAINILSAGLKVS